MSKKNTWIRVAVVGLLVLSLGQPLTASASPLLGGSVHAIGGWWGSMYVHLLQYFAPDAVGRKAGMGMDPDGAPEATPNGGQGGEAGMGMDPDGVSGSGSSTSSSASFGSSVPPQS